MRTRVTHLWQFWPIQQTRLLLWTLLVFIWIQFGFLCSPTSRGDDFLPVARISAFTLTIADPSQGLRAVKVQFKFADTDSITSFSIYRSDRPDSLGAPVLEGIKASAREALVLLPDASPPYTVYFGVKAIRQLETGETFSSDSIPVDSLLILEPIRIYKPAIGSEITVREMEIEVGTGSDLGIRLRQSWYENRGGLWVPLLDTCLPRNDCNTPFFGATFQRDTLIFNESKDKVNTLFCVLGLENQEENDVIRRQSLICNRLSRKAP